MKHLRRDGVCAFLAILAISLPSIDTRAQSTGTCTLNGSPVMPKTMTVSTMPSGGEVIAKFTGQAIATTATLTAGNRARIKTGTGTGGFRIEGFVDVETLPAFTTRNVPVVAGHVWIGGGKPVHLAFPANGPMTIEITASAPIDQTLKTTAPCDAIALDLPSISQPSPPGNARGWLAKKSPLELRGDPGGQSIFTFTSSSVKDALLFWSTERSGSQVHVMLGGDIAIDGWIAASDLEALKQGEMLDALASGTTSVSQAKLIMEGANKTAKVTKDVPIRAKPSDTASTIGAIESGGEVLVMETVQTWSNVLPTSLAVVPGDANGFWVKTADLVIQPAK